MFVRPRRSSVDNDRVFRRARATMKNWLSPCQILDPFITTHVDMEVDSLAPRTRLRQIDIDDCPVPTRHSLRKSASKPFRTLNPKTCAQNQKKIRRCGYILGDDVTNCLAIPMLPV